MAPPIPRSILGILRTRLPIAIMGIPTNTQPAAKNSGLQRKIMTLTAGSRKRSPAARPDTNQQMANDANEITMRIDSIGVGTALEINIMHYGFRASVGLGGPHLKSGCPIFATVSSSLIGVPASFAGGVSLGGPSCEARSVFLRQIRDIRTGPGSSRR